jgi:sorting nexin-8
MPSHFSLPLSSAESDDDLGGDNESLASSVFSGIIHPGRLINAQLKADTARLTSALRVLVEVNQRCWRGDECDLCTGVRQGVSTVAQHTERHGDALEHRVCTPNAVFFLAIKQFIRLVQ